MFTEFKDMLRWKIIHKDNLMHNPTDITSVYNIIYKVQYIQYYDKATGKKILQYALIALHCIISPIYLLLIGSSVQ